MTSIVTPVRVVATVRNSYTRTDFPGQVLLNGFNGTTSGNLGVSDTTTGTSNKDYKALIAKHRDASSSYTRKVSEYRGIRVSASSWGWPLYPNKNARFDAQCSGVQWFDPSVLIDTSSDSQLAAVALQRLKKKITSAANQTNVLIPVVELRELRQTIVAVMNSTSQVLLAALTAKKTKGASVAKAVSNLWLTWSFGIKPMLSDIKAISDSINDMINGQERNVVLTGSSKKFWTTHYSNQAVPAPYFCTGKAYWEVGHELSYKYTAGLDLNVRSANNYGVSSQLGVNLQGLPSVLWELTAFSWAVDYFANVGSFLDDTFSVDANNTVYCTLGKKYTCTAHGTGSLVESVKGYSFLSNSNCSPGFFRYHEFVRTPFGTTIPSTNLRIKSLDEVGKNASNKLANLLSVYSKSLPGHLPSGPFKH